LIASTFPPAVFQDGDFQSAINVPPGTADSPATLKLAYDAPQTVRSATLFVPGRTMFSGASVLPRLEASLDGTTWRKLADLPMSTAPTTVSFAPVTARDFRVVFEPAAAAPMMRETAPGAAGGEMFAALGNNTQPVKVGELQLSPQS